MALATHLGPWLVGTVKNPSNTSTTVSSSQIGTYRNCGATVAVQTSPGGLLYTTTSNTTLTSPGNVVNAVGGTSSTTLTLTATNANIVSGMTVVGPGIAAGTTVTSVSGTAVTLSAAVSSSATSPAPFLFYVATAGYNNNPLVIPAGSLITNMYVDVLTAFNATGTTSTTGTITISLLNSTATYTLATLVSTSTTSGSFAVGRYALGAAQTGATGPTINFNTTAIGAMLLTNISSGQNTPTDGIIQVKYGDASTGTLTTATTGMASVTIEYAVRNPDGTYFPQSPNPAYTNVVY